MTGGFDRMMYPMLRGKRSVYFILFFFFLGVFLLFLGHVGSAETGYAQEEGKLSHVGLGPQPHGNRVVEPGRDQLRRRRATHGRGDVPLMSPPGGGSWFGHIGGGRMGASARRDARRVRGGGGPIARRGWRGGGVVRVVVFRS